MRSKKASTMSFDSRLLRPSRSNSSSASSALVSVGVTSVGIRTRSGGMSVRAIAVALLLSEAHAEASFELGHDARDDPIDVLVGERAIVVSQFEAKGEAALAFGE